MREDLVEVPVEVYRFCYKRPEKSKNITLNSNFTLCEVEKVLSSAGYDLKDYQDAIIIFGRIGLSLKNSKEKTISQLFKDARGRYQDAVSFEKLSIRLEEKI